MSREDWIVEYDGHRWIVLTQREDSYSIMRYEHGVRIFEKRPEENLTFIEEAPDTRIGRMTACGFDIDSPEDVETYLCKSTNDKHERKANVEPGTRLILEVEEKCDGWAREAKWDYWKYNDIEDARKSWDELADEYEVDLDGLVPFIIGVTYEYDGKKLTLNDIDPIFTCYSFDDVLSAINYGVEHDVFVMSLFEYGALVLRKKNLVD